MARIALTVAAVLATAAVGLLLVALARGWRPMGQGPAGGAGVAGGAGAAGGAARAAAAVAPPTDQRLLIEAAPIATINPDAQWCMVQRIADLSRAAGSGATPTPEGLSSERLVAQPRGGEWYLLLHAAPSSIVDCASAKPGGGGAGEIKTGVRTDDTGAVRVTIELPPPLAIQVRNVTTVLARGGATRLAFVLDGKVLVAPTVMTPLNELLMLAGIKTKADAEWIAARIRDHPSSLRLQGVVTAGELPDEEGLRGDFRSDSAAVPAAAPGK
jgi:hypothetical protein